MEMFGNIIAYKQTRNVSFTSTFPEYCEVNKLYKIYNCVTWSRGKKYYVLGL